MLEDGWMFEQLLKRGFENAVCLNPAASSKCVSKCAFVFLRVCVCVCVHMCVCRRVLDESAVQDV